jgi:predicted AAA+ superfamily ATPase
LDFDQLSNETPLDFDQKRRNIALVFDQKANIMFRNIYKTLLNWKSDKARKPLLLRGARQIGKTYIIQEFGKNEYGKIICLNFERNPEYKTIFSSFDPKEIAENILLFTGHNILEKNTLLFLDEIQDCPNAIMALRYFHEEKPEIPIIGTGSLLEFALEAENFRMPVGRVQYAYMYPLSFSEFLIALNQKHLSEYVSKQENLRKTTPELHQKLLGLLRKYFVLGGMPEVVAKYSDTQNIKECQRIQHAIIETYRDDFAKYSRSAQLKYVQTVFNAVPTIIGQKVTFSDIDKSVKSRDLQNAFNLLLTAGVINKVKRTSGAGLPLEAGIKENYYKPLFMDIGLMHAMNGIYSETIQETDLTAIYKAAVTEQFVGQELLAISSPLVRPHLYYWLRDKKNSSAEIDYLVLKKEKVIPVEVKSGKKGSLKSLGIFLKTFKIERGVKISQAPFMEEEGLLSLPLYALESFFAQK